METSKNLNEFIEKYISSNNIKYFEYNHFSNFQKIGSGSFGKVYRANWKNSKQYLALKSFHNFNNATVKEIVHEVITKYISVCLL